MNWHIAFVGALCALASALLYDIKPDMEATISLLAIAAGLLAVATACVDD